ncbi:hypothetical protein D3C80_1142370 [compost metagenome]
MAYIVSLLNFLIFRYANVTLTIRLATHTSTKNANCNIHIFLFSLISTRNKISTTVSSTIKAINAPHVNSAFSSLGFSITNQATKHALAIFKGVNRIFGYRFLKLRFDPVALPPDFPLLLAFGLKPEARCASRTSFCLITYFFSWKAP